MDEYSIKCYIANDEDENIRELNLNDKEMEEWKEDVMARALSEFYDKKIKITSQKNLI